MLHFIHHTAFHKSIVGLCICGSSKAQTLGGNDIFCPCVGGHDDNGIFKVDLPSLGICDMTVVQNL